MHEIDSIAEALCVSVVKSLGTIILAGFGCRLKAFQCPAGTICLDVAILHGARIHGIVPVEDKHHGVIIAVHGARQLVIATLTCPRSNAQSPCSPPLQFHILHHATQFAQWILDARFASVFWPSTNTDRSHDDCQKHFSCDVALGMMNNSVELWRIENEYEPSSLASGTTSASATRLAAAASSERLLLYSMRLAVAPQPSESEASTHPCIMVASGTIFHTVLVWAVHFDDSKDSIEKFLRCAPCYKLTGHCGSVLRMQWACDQRVLLSTADDRTARMWRLPENWWLQSDRSSGSVQDDALLVHTLWGHTARVWDAVLMGSLVATAAEDGAVRVWDAHTAQCITVTRCHGGHGAWCCTAVGSHMLCTGGGDCALKLWNLAELLPVHARQKLTDCLSPSELQLHSEEKYNAQYEVSGTPHTATEMMQSSTMKLTVPLPRPEDLAHQHKVDSIGGNCSNWSTAEPPSRHDSSKEGVCALAMSARTAVYVATTLGRVLRMDLLLNKQHDKETEAVWSSVCTAPQQHMPLSCCAARRYSIIKHPALAALCTPYSISVANNGSCENRDSSQTQRNMISDAIIDAVDVVVCGSRQSALTVACMPACTNSQPAVPNSVHMQLSEMTQAPILAVWMPACLPPGHVICADANNNVWWVFVRLSATTSCANSGDDVEDTMVVVSTCDCGPKTRVSSVEVLPGSGLLVVGDSLGGVAAFSVPQALFSVETSSNALAFVGHKSPQLNSSGHSHGQGEKGAPVRMVCTSAFRKIHATTPVTLAKAVGRTLFTGGRNGTLATWTVVDDSQEHQEGMPSSGSRIVCCREVRVAALTGVVDALLPEESSSQNELLVAGFKANMFMLWDVEAEVELLSAASGGWRRPFAVWLGSRSCFTVALVKEYQLQVLVRTKPATIQAPEDTVHGCDRADTKPNHDRDSGELQQKDVDCNTGPAAPGMINARTLVLMPPHHGKIVHACVCLQLSMHLVAVVTTSEDGCVRVVSYRCDKQGNVLPGAVSRLLLGKHAAGGAIRCLDAVHINSNQATASGEQWLLLSAGAKEVQAAWELSVCSASMSFNPDDEPNPDTMVTPRAVDSVQGRWLATMPPPKVGLRPKRNVGFHTAVGERRTMALCLFRARGSTKVSEEHCFVVQAASAGSLQLTRFCGKALQWLQVAELRHGAFVVLSIATASTSGGRYSAKRRTITCAGSTEGNIWLFDLTEAVQNEIGGLQAAGKQRAVPSSNDRLVTVCDPILKLPRAHATGVNAINFIEVDDLIWLVSGGDDQSICVTLLQWNTSTTESDESACNSSETKLHALDTVVVDCAHVSAVKGLCCRVATRADGSTILQVCSIGWDEFVRVWEIGCGQAAGAGRECSSGYGRTAATTAIRECCGATVVVREIVNYTVDVCEPCCVAGCDSGLPGGAWNVVVGGRGTELLCLQV